MYILYNVLKDKCITIGSIWKEKRPAILNIEVEAYRKNSIIKLHFYQIRINNLFSEIYSILKNIY